MVGSLAQVASSIYHIIARQKVTLLCSWQVFVLIHVQRNQYPCRCLLKKQALRPQATEMRWTLNVRQGHFAVQRIALDMRAGTRCKHYFYGLSCILHLWYPLTSVTRCQHLKIIAPNTSAGGFRTIGSLPVDGVVSVCVVSVIRHSPIW